MSDMFTYLKHFDFWEFDSPDQKGSGLEMEGDFLIMLDMAREIAKIPFIITSGYRTLEHNRVVHGSTKSSHMKGYAADISYDNERDGLIIVSALTLAGFRRIGKGSNFIHCDNDPKKSSPAYWTYTK